MIAEPQKRNWQGGTTASETRWGNALSREVHDISGPIGYIERISCRDSERHLLKIWGVEIGMERISVEWAPVYCLGRAL
jgi:hypothetical protein